jgi:type IV pilus assembly protein PilF
MRSARGSWSARAAALLLVLAGCAGTPPPAPVESEAGRDLVTASDRTDSERRARVRLELANAYFERGQVETALDEVKLSLLAKPDFVDALTLRGLIYAALGEGRLAEESFKRALQVSPNDGAVMNSYAWFLCQRDRAAEADALFQQVLALPQYRDVKRTLHARGVCLSRAGRWVEAEGALMRAYELDPGNPMVGFNLAEVLYRRKEYARAGFYIARVNDTEGATNAQTLWLAACIAHRLGDEAAARRLGEQLRGRFPQSPQALQFERGQFDD